MKYKIYFPNDGDCLWLNCPKKGYEVNNGYCYAHRVQGKELGKLRQCSFFDKKGFCMIATAEKFKDRFYCSSHHKLLIEYDKEIKEQIKILNEEEKKGKMIELVRVLENYISSKK
ncbi:MAG: hypothetical protein MRERV_39c014 [Mycoplasmataceae bacterium RV_VA103A]|nr:MAG: hypothetical protein MRERV_39c014 [Mycoplasmataceae bacterium RV_VA103A]